MKLEEEKKILALANEYVNNESDNYFKNEVLNALKNNDFNFLYESFYKSLEFGTAGLRGIIGGGNNRINTYIVKKITQGLSNYLLSCEEKPSCVIAYDSRNFSHSFAKEAALVLASNNIKTYLFSSLRPVPILSYSIRELHTSVGIVITASHNPAKYNGYKVYWKDGGQVTPPHDINIASCVQNVSIIKTINEEKAIESGYLCYIDDKIDTSYYKMVLSQIKRKELFESPNINVCYTPLHGSGNVPLTTLLNKLNITTHIVKEQEEANGDFPTVSYPNPESKEAMKMAIDLAIKTKSDIVLGTDPDADRLGIAIPKDNKRTDYLLLSGNQIAILLSDYLLSSPNFNKTPVIVKSLVTTDLVKKIANRNGAKCIDVLTGFKYIANEIRKLENDNSSFFLFGAEESYGYLSNTHVRDKDAVSSAVLAVEMLLYYKSINKTLIQRLEEIYNEYGHYQEAVFSSDFEGSIGQEKMKDIMTSFRSLKIGSMFLNREIVELEDLLNSDIFPKSNVIIIKFNTGDKLIIRPSGTEPKIKYYIFTTNNIKEIVNEFKTKLST